jgi:hypothetical protein
MTIQDKVNKIAENWAFSLNVDLTESQIVNSDMGFKTMEFLGTRNGSPVTMYLSWYENTKDVWGDIAENNGNWFADYEGDIP